MPAVTVLDGWELAVHAIAGARFVGPDEYRERKLGYVVTSLLAQVVTDALANAADQDGVLEDFDQPAFFQRHVAALLSEQAGEELALTYDTFTAMALVDTFTSLRAQGLLGHRGKGGSYDYRLALPEPPGI